MRALQRFMCQLPLREKSERAQLVQVYLYCGKRVLEPFRMIRIDLYQHFNISDNVNVIQLCFSFVAIVDLVRAASSFSG